MRFPQRKSGIFFPGAYDTSSKVKLNRKVFSLQFPCAGEKTLVAIVSLACIQGVISACQLKSFLIVDFFEEFIVFVNISAASKLQP